MADSYVCSGATMRCTMGTSQARLRVLSTRTVFLTGKPQANISDHLSFVNLGAFGRCRSMGFPATEAATAAAHGKLTPMPCMHNTPNEWMGGKMDYLIKGQPALLKSSKCQCMWGGTISLVTDGQTDTGPADLSRKTVQHFAIPTKQQEKNGIITGGVSNLSNESTGIITGGASSPFDSPNNIPITAKLDLLFRCGMGIKDTIVFVRQWNHLSQEEEERLKEYEELLNRIDGLMLSDLADPESTKNRLRKEIEIKFKKDSTVKRIVVATLGFDALQNGFKDSSPHQLGKNLDNAETKFDDWLKYFKGDLERYESMGTTWKGRGKDTNPENLGVKGKLPSLEISKDTQYNESELKKINKEKLDDLYSYRDDLKKKINEYKAEGRPQQQIDLREDWLNDVEEEIKTRESYWSPKKWGEDFDSSSFNILHNLDRAYESNPNWTNNYYQKGAQNKQHNNSPYKASEDKIELPTADEILSIYKKIELGLPLNEREKKIVNSI